MSRSPVSSPCEPAAGWSETAGARDLGQDLLEAPHELERALRPLFFLERMQVAEPGEVDDSLVDPGLCFIVHEPSG